MGKSENGKGTETEEADYRLHCQTEGKVEKSGRV
jgi:hypothetical protein